MKQMIAIFCFVALSGCAMMRGGLPPETVDEVDLERDNAAGQPGFQ